MYIDAYHDKQKDRIRVAERRNGKTILRDYPVPYRLYAYDPDGIHRSVFDEPLTRYDIDSQRSFYKLKEKFNSEGVALYESDCNLLFRFLAENYQPEDVPDLNVAFFDIEVDFDPEVGFADPADPYAPVNAISIYLQWAQELITLAVPPKGMSKQEAEQEVADLKNCFIFADEVGLLDTFLVIIEEANILSGWNSTSYDIPYLVNRVKRTMGDQHAKRFCLWELDPKERIYLKFKRDHQTYDLIGRVHLDYLELYEKNTYHEIHSKKLDYVGKLEVGEQKIPYSGTLDALYRDDFRKFVEYNRQDTMILDKLDRKLKFIELSNTMAHSNGVLLQTTLKSVALIDQAIMNEAHRRNMIVFDKKGLTSDGPAAGAYVADPIVGLHDYVGAIDINSLYPSVIRALNMSPDTIFGQIRPTLTNQLLSERIGSGASNTDAWHDMFGTYEYQEVMEQKDTPLLLDLVGDDGPVEMPAKDIYEMIFADDSPLCLSANGTIFRTDVEGIIPGLLSRWYSERKQMQAKKKDYDKMIAGVEVPAVLAARLETVNRY